MSLRSKHVQSRKCLIYLIGLADNYTLLCAKCIHVQVVYESDIDGRDLKRVFNAFLCVTYFFLQLTDI